MNLTPAQLRKWLGTEKSREAGQHMDGGESTGHASGRRIVEILSGKKGGLSGEDYEHMRKVIGYIRRHLAQKPSGDTEDTRWRHSLTNRGHDPSKK